MEYIDKDPPGKQNHNIFIQDFGMIIRLQNINFYGSLFNQNTVRAAVCPW